MTITRRSEGVVRPGKAATARRLEEPPPEGGDPAPPAADEHTSAADNEALRKMLEQMADRKRQQLQELPEDVPGRIKGLSEYDFMDNDARAKFQELLQLLQQQVLESYFQGMLQAIQSITPE